MNSLCFHPDLFFAFICWGRAAAEMDHQGGALGQGHHYENLVLKKLLTSWQLVNIKCRPLGLRVSTPICAHVVISCSQMIARQAGRTGCTSDLEEIKEVLTWIDCSPWSVGALGSKKNGLERRLWTLPSTLQELHGQAHQVSPRVQCLQF